MLPYLMRYGDEKSGEPKGCGDVARCSRQQASEAAAQLWASKVIASLLRRTGQLVWIIGWPQEIKGSQKGRLGRGGV